MKLSSKIASGFTTIVAILIVVGVVAYSVINMIDSGMTNIAERDIPAMGFSGDMVVNGMKAIIEQKDYVKAKNSLHLEDCKKELDNLHKVINQYKELAQSNNNQQAINKLQGITADVENFRRSLDQVAQSFSNNEAKNTTLENSGKKMSEIAENYISSKLTSLDAGRMALYFLNDMNNESMNMRMAKVHAILAATDEESEEAFTTLSDHSDTIVEYCQELNDLNPTAEEKTIIEKVGKGAELYKELVKTYLDKSSEKTEELSTKIEDTGVELADAINEYRNMKTAEMAKANNAMALINEWAINLHKMRASTFKYQSLGLEEDLEMTGGFKGKMDALLEDVVEYAHNQDELDNLELAKQSVIDYHVALKEWVMVDNRIKNELLPALMIAGEKAINAARELSVDVAANTVEQANKSKSVASFSKGVMIISLCIGSIIGIVLAVFITRSIVKPINRVIAELTCGSDEVANAAHQVSEASNSLADSTTDQAGKLVDTNNSLDEMASQIKQNAANAIEANQLATETSDAANNGAEAMKKMETAIQDIQKSSEETSKIIKTIDEIAFQTNLLALNAAVEAARAGEAGKGFAVVAEEVRNLAMRSAEAARNTTEMIEQSVSNSNTGVEISAEVGSSLGRISEAVNKTSSIVSEITAACQDQSEKIDAINQSMESIDRITQSTAASAEESAAAAHELNCQSDQMKDVVHGLTKMVGGGSGGREASKIAANAFTGISLADEAIHSISDAVDMPVDFGGDIKNSNDAEAAIPFNDETDFDEFN